MNMAPGIGWNTDIDIMTTDTEKEEQNMIESTTIMGIIAVGTSITMETTTVMGTMTDRSR